jgi:hypothetical protein
MSFSTPILFITFNRLETTKKVFEQISLIKPQKLYISSDGPRLNKKNEINLVIEIREYLLSSINWECEVHTLFFEENNGCKKAVSSSINWLFQNEKKGIILEDDCLPNSSFFNFCEQMLDLYEFDKRIWHISGYNFFNEKKFTNFDYNFTKYINVWGWATWSDRWSKYDVAITNFKQFNLNNEIININFSKKANNFWLKAFLDVYNNKIDTWDYQWVFTVLSNNGLSIIPQKNLISNIGFGTNATHTFSDHVGYSNKKLETLDRLILTHPTFILENKLISDAFNNIYIKKNIFKRIINKLKLFSK